jgi:predicted Fe-Mo cluster-binding NifX family protein
MKRILVTSSQPDLEGKMEKRFGHSKYFILADLDTFDFKAIPNAVEGQNAISIRELLELKPDAILTGNIGPGSFDTLQSLKIPVYIVRGKTVRQALEALRAGELTPADKPSMKNSPHDGGGFGLGHHDGDHDHDHEHGQGLGRGMGRGMGRGQGRGLGRGRGMGGGFGLGRGLGRGRGKDF